MTFKDSREFRSGEADKGVGGRSSGGSTRSLEDFVLENPAVNLRALLLPSHKCCYGHASNDRLYTSYDPSNERSEVQGPTNAEVSVCVNTCVCRRV